MKMLNPLVSVCMPAYNAENFIGESIASLIRQSYQNWELIVVNDGSTDQTSVVLASISDPRIRVYHQENAGQCAAANQAFQFSKGDLIKFMDADDLLSPFFLENQVRRLDAQDSAIAFASWGRFYNNDIRTFKLSRSFPEYDADPFDWLVNTMSHEQVMLQCALWLIPRQILMVSGLWDERLSLINDFEFFIRVLLAANRLLFTTDAILYYRSGDPHSLSALKSDEGAHSAYLSIDMGTGYLLARTPSTAVKKIAADCFQRFVYSFYPFHPKLLAQAEKRISELGGSDAPPPAGGFTLLLQLLIGWKLARRFKLFIATIINWC